MVCLSLRKREKNRNGTIYFYLTSWTTWNTFIASLRKQMTFWDATNATIQIWVVRDISIEISALVSHWRHFAGKPLVGSQNVVCFNFSGSYFSMQCIMYWLIMNNRITLKKLTKKKTRIGMLLRRETGNEHEKREIEKRERNERIGDDVTDRVNQGLS